MERDFQSVCEGLCDGPDLAAQQRTTFSAVLQLVAANAFESLAQYFTENVELHICGYEEFAGSWHGRQAVCKAILSNFSKVTNQQTVSEAMIQQQDAIAVRIAERGEFVATREKYEMRAVLWVTFEDTKIRRIDEFTAPLGYPRGG